MKRHPENAVSVGARRRQGAPLLALAVCVDLNGAGVEWLNGVDTDWMGIEFSRPVASYDYAVAAGLVCVVFASDTNRRSFAAINELYRAGAREVWLDRADGVYRIARPQVGEPVVATDGPLMVSQVLSLARASRLSRRAA